MSSAFSAYAVGGAQSFVAPTPRRGGVFGETSSGNVLGGGGQDSGKEDDSSGEGEGSSTSFGARLRAERDASDGEASDAEERRVRLTEQEVRTGEEEEDTVYQVRGKLFTLSAQNQWKERGTGMLRLNVRRQDGSGARLGECSSASWLVVLAVY